MAQSTQDLHLVSDFNLANFANLLKSKVDDGWRIKLAPLDQVVPFLSEVEADPKGHVWIWTRPERISPSFHAALNYQEPESARVLLEVHRFADLLIAAADRWNHLYVPLWQIPVSESYGAGELNYTSGVHALVLRMNAKLCELVEKVPNIQVMHSDRWTQAVGPKAWSKRLWYLTKTPFSNEVFHAAANDLIAIWKLAEGQGIKLIVLDLDDTLWGGIVGDDGWENLHVGGHDPIGESFVDFQRTLKGLKDRGIMLAIASKNEEATALEAMEKHPEMILRRSDFVAMRIDWNDKAGNIRDMVKQLNIGERSVMFIDDNPVEQSRVKTFLPDVYVPEWPANKLLYEQELRRLNVFDLASVSAEDARRTVLYKEEADREHAKAGMDSVEAWLRSLEMKITAQPLNEADFTRVHQLFLKTNQFNLTTRRLTEKELRDWMAHADHELWSFRVSDQFGDAGLTGVLGLDLSVGPVALITDLILSCRVMGRRVEETLLHVAYKQALGRGKVMLKAIHMPTERNKPCLDFLLKSGMVASADDHTFIWTMENPYPCPGPIVLITPVSASRI
ncbi:MAG: HAD-IIIC family phosphatase [Flavobacteriales bacterium]